MTRRQFSGLAAGAVAACGQTADLWGGPVVDCHHHLRLTAEANIVHLDGCGVSHAMMLARDNSLAQIQEIQQQYHGRL